MVETPILFLLIFGGLSSRNYSNNHVLFSIAMTDNKHSSRRTYSKDHESIFVGRMFCIKYHPCIQVTENRLSLLE